MKFTKKTLLNFKDTIFKLHLIVSWFLCKSFYKSSLLLVITHLIANKPLKLVNQFKYLDNNLLSTESDVNIHLAKVWTAIDRLLMIWKSNLSDKINWDFFQAVAVSVFLYGCTTWMLTKCMRKKLDGNYTRTLCAV